MALSFEKLKLTGTDAGKLLTGIWSRAKKDCPDPKLFGDKDFSPTILAYSNAFSDFQKKYAEMNASFEKAVKAYKAVAEINDEYRKRAGDKAKTDDKFKPVQISLMEISAMLCGGWRQFYNKAWTPVNRKVEELCAFNKDRMEQVHRILMGEEELDPQL
jgi:hypothetical protein